MAYAIPEDYGAVGDGSTPDTAAMQAFVADLIATGQEGHLTGGKTYVLVAPGTDTVILDLTKGIRLYGNGATIKIADESTGFHAILGSKDSGDDLSGLWIEGVVFDHNAQNEDGEPAVSSSLLTLPRCTVKAKKGAGLAVVDCVVLNAVSTNCIELNGDGNSSDTRVRGCRFYMAEPNGDVYFDHSTLYLTGDNIEAVDNYFENASWGSANGTCAIEVHPGFQYVVSRNRVFAFHTGMNIAGIYDTDSRGGLVQDNVIETLRRGIFVLSGTYADHSSGYGIDGLNIDGNHICIRNATAQGNMTGGGVGAFGILLNGAGLATRDIAIGDNNQVVFDLESSAPDWDSLPAGVGVGDATGSSVHENFSIGAMLIENSPCFGVALGGAGGVLKNCRVRGTRIVRPGQTAKSDVNLGSWDYRAGIWIQPASISGSLLIEDVEIIDDLSTTRMRNAFVLQAGGAVTAPVDIGARVVISGATTTAFANTVCKFDNNIVPKVRIEQNIVPLTASSGATFRKGSLLIDRPNAIEYEMRTDGGTAFSARLIEASATYNPPSLADGAGVTTTVTLGGALLGDFAQASFSNALADIVLTAWVSATNTVSVRFQNESGGTVDLASGTLRVRVSKV